VRIGLGIPDWSERRRGALAIGAAAVGTFTAIFGFLAVVAFNTSPGVTGAPPLHWPHGAGIAASARIPQVLIFVHPLCGCTAASIAELAKLTELQRPNGADIAFLVFRPNSGSSWSRHALEEDVRYLPASRLLWDDGGAEAKRFGVRTSGTVLLYNAAGDLLFYGGVTGARGHEGGNYGIDTLAQLLRNPPPARTVPARAKIFGCAL